MTEARSYGLGLAHKPSNHLAAWMRLQWDVIGGLRAQANQLYLRGANSLQG